MCYQVKCGTCSKSTWAGCGRHVASVHQQIPEGQHCACRDWPGVSAAGGKKSTVGSGAEKGTVSSGNEKGAVGSGTGEGEESTTRAIL